MWRKGLITLGLLTGIGQAGKVIDLPVTPTIKSEITLKAKKHESVKCVSGYQYMKDATIHSSRGFDMSYQQTLGEFSATKARVPSFIYETHKKGNTYWGIITGPQGTAFMYSELRSDGAYTMVCNVEI